MYYTAQKPDTPSIGDNINPCPISMYFTRQWGRNLVSLAIFAKIVKVLDQKKLLIKESLSKSMAQIFSVIFITLKRQLFWKSVESYLCVNSVT